MKRCGWRRSEAQNPMTTAELRWILLAICSVLFGALVWWERRRPRQANGHPERSTTLRDVGADSTPGARTEPALTLPTMRAREPAPPHELPVVEAGSARARAHPPASEEARGSDSPTDEVAALAAASHAQPIPAGPAGAIVEETFEYVPKAAVAGADAVDTRRTQPPSAPAPPREVLPVLPASAAPTVEWPPDDQRQIVAVRLIAPLPERFAGRSLRQALAAEGFVLGRFAIFHKPDESHRAVLSAASLTRPGTFDADTMDSQHFGGLSLFAVLPGPKAPPQAFDELVITARSLNERLHGVLQDEQGSPLTPSRIALLRERLRPGATL
jgi:cell division protein ZipA